MTKRLLAGSLLLSFIAPFGADAHHSRPAFYDMSQTIEIAGEITRVQWRHPHVRYWIQTDPEFGGEVWELETTPPSLLERQGITREILSAGTVSYTHLTLPTTGIRWRSRWSAGG